MGFPFRVVPKKLCLWGRRPPQLLPFRMRAPSPEPRELLSAPENRGEAAVRGPGRPPGHPLTSLSTFCGEGPSRAQGPDWEVIPSSSTQVLHLGVPVGAPQFLPPPFFGGCVINPKGEKAKIWRPLTDGPPCPKAHVEGTDRVTGSEAWGAAPEAPRPRPHLLLPLSVLK